MKTMSNISGGYDMLQGADAPGDLRVFSIAATAAVLVVSCVVAFKMVAPDIRAAWLSHVPVAAQWVAGPTAARSETPVQSSIAIGEH